ncbi:MAG: hypothetical protein M1431_07545 [Candidatus Thermoplasmatota archaeon]|nr:hypothetical protein [Candidatus Thermoplasmatota archaeon]
MLSRGTEFIDRIDALTERKMAETGSRIFRRFASYDLKSDGGDKFLDLVISLKALLGAGQKMRYPIGSP